MSESKSRSLRGLWSKVKGLTTIVPSPAEDSYTSDSMSSSESNPEDNEEPLMPSYGKDRDPPRSSRGIYWSSLEPIDKPVGSPRTSRYGNRSLPLTASLTPSPTSGVRDRIDSSMPLTGGKETTPYKYSSTSNYNAGDHPTIEAKHHHSDREDSLVKSTGAKVSTPPVQDDSGNKSTMVRSRADDRPNLKFRQRERSRAPTSYVQDDSENQRTIARTEGYYRVRRAPEHITPSPAIPLSSKVVTELTNDRKKIVLPRKHEVLEVVLQAEPDGPPKLDIREEYDGLPKANGRGEIPKLLTRQLLELHESYEAQKLDEKLQNRNVAAKKLSSSPEMLYRIRRGELPLRSSESTTKATTVKMPDFHSIETLTKKPSNASRPVFGVPVAQSVTYAAITGHMSTYGMTKDKPQSHIVPIVIDKCGSFLTTYGWYGPALFLTPGDPARVRRLVEEFSSEPRYGVYSWPFAGYKMHDIAAVFLLYFQRLPEPVIPRAYFKDFLKPCQRYQNSKKSSSVVHKISSRYDELFLCLEPANRELLRYTLNVLSFFALNDYMSARDLAEIFQPGLLRPPNRIRGEETIGQAVDVITFLVELQNSFTTSRLSDRQASITPKTTKIASTTEPAVPNNSDAPGGDQPIKPHQVDTSPEAVVDPGPVAIRRTSQPLSTDKTKQNDASTQPDDNSSAIERPQVSNSVKDLSSKHQERTAELLENGPPLPLQSTNNKTKSKPEPTKAIFQVQNLDSMFQSHQEHEQVFSEIEITEITQFLQKDSPSWAKIPRIYIVLRLIGCLDICDAVVNSGCSDYELPFSTRDLPRQLSAEAHPKFLAAQSLVKTKIIDLECGAAGQHHHFDAGDPFPFDICERLGSGGFGQVDRVVSLKTNKEFALKRVTRRAVSTGKGLAGLRGVIREIGILKTLTHRHIVQFVGSYTDQKFLGLLMTPVAKLDFADYLAQAKLAQHSSIRSFFGCLTAGLKYLHTQKIRHKDITPRNILVSQGSVLLTDFGLARDFTDATGSTSVGPSNFLSPRYAAPEVLLMEERNTKSDIWSLGIVFLEMIVVLKNWNNERLDEFMVGNGFENMFVRNNRPGFEKLVVELQNNGSKADNIALEWVGLMVHQQHIHRPSAAELLQKIVYDTEGSAESGRFCGLCCRDEDDLSDESD